ncbi:hypothetical protein [Streptomyces sp. NPDC056921]|uniref:hypothetical protein n=1 Tax=Streptomyces sp. NPDC056921 TaxID=3345966 RepID=UPI00362A1231
MTHIEDEPGAPCARQTWRDGERFTCPGTYELRVAAYFDRGVAKQDGPVLTFTALGGRDGTEGIVINCTECGMPAPRILYAGIMPALQAAESKLKKLLK